MNKLKTFFKKVQTKIHKYNYSKKIKNKNITIISQNCIGGVLYNLMRLPFQSPTINVFIEDENFVKLAEDPEHYFSIPATAFKDNYIDPINSNIHYPIIQVDDIQICCLHYKNCKDAVEAWNRRRQRVNFDNIYVIANSWNLHEKKDLFERLDNLPYKTIIFTYENYDFKSCIYLEGDKWHKDERGIVRPDITALTNDGYTREFEHLVDFQQWFNEK